VNPKQAEVWVDGKYVADARDLDGDPSYLWLKQGTHHIVVYKAGFRSFDEDVDVNVGMIRQLKLKLEKGESQPPARASADVRREPRAESSAPSAQIDEPRHEHGGGLVHLHVQPRDATVYVDGEYRGSSRELVELRLAAGHHKVELVRPGFQPLEKEFELPADKAIDIDLSMERAGLKY
jgi:hypothetical protein